MQDEEEMTIKMLFEKPGVYFIIEIKDKIISYWDRYNSQVWGSSLQYLPPDPNAKKRVIESRNKIPAMFLDLLTVSDDELKEYNEAKTDEELKDIILRDCQKNSCKLIDLKIQ